MPVPHSHVRGLARVVFTVFLLTFIASRVLVILIMARMMPDLFLHMGGTHVHHLNYGIFLLCTVAAVMLFFQLSDRERWWCAVAYGFSLALTFDEFGMWLHLGGGYWQRASFDAVIVVASLFGMLAFCPPWPRCARITGSPASSPSSPRFSSTCCFFTRSTSPTRTSARACSGSSNRDRCSRNLQRRALRPLHSCECRVPFTSVIHRGNSSHFTFGTPRA